MSELQRVVLHDTNTNQDVSISAQGRLAIDSNSSSYATAYDYDANGNLIYLGKATTGSATSSAVWQVKKLIYTSGNLTSILWAGGTNSFVNIWDNRVSLSYS